jgi:hypothetical protein
LGKNPPSTKPFWNRINNIRGEQRRSAIPTLVVNNVKYTTDEQKADLFLTNLKDTFSFNDNPIFDSEFKTQVESKINRVDFTKHEFNKKNLFEFKDLNYEMKKLNKRSANGEDEKHNKMIQKTYMNLERSYYILLMKLLSNQKFHINGKIQLFV